MEVRAVGMTLDTNDPVRIADFWQAAIGFTKRVGDGNPYITLSESPVGRPINHLTIQRVPEPKTAKHRLHLDLFVRDLEAAIDRLVGLGATLMDPPSSEPGHMGMRNAVLLDPDGGEFCIVARIH